MKNVKTIWKCSGISVAKDVSTINGNGGVG